MCECHAVCDSVWFQAQDIDPSAITVCVRGVSYRPPGKTGGVIVKRRLRLVLEKWSKLAPGAVHVAKNSNRRRLNGAQGARQERSVFYG